MSKALRILPSWRDGGRRRSVEDMVLIIGGYETIAGS